MPAAVRPPQMDLFDVPPEPPRQRVGRKPHVPTPEQLRLAYEMKASGAARTIIARALGVCVITVDRRYFPSNKRKQPIGRPRHKPSLYSREIVRRAVRWGMTRVQIAKLIGISAPALRRYYSEELRS